MARNVWVFGAEAHFSLFLAHFRRYFYVMAYDISDLCQKYAGLSRLWEIFPEARLVGGAVRDPLLGLFPQDIDMAVPFPPEEIIARLKRASQRFIPTGIAHGTVSALIKGACYELTALRQDVETDGRHAKVAWTADWKIDAERRDFTINAMSLDKEGNLYDYFGGEADLKAGLVRFVGDASSRISEDYLRILRYFRFSARFGRNPPSKEILEIISQNLSGFKHLAKERLRDEFSRFLLGPKIIETLQAMEKSGVLASLLPYYDLTALEKGLEIDLPKDFILRLSLLCAEKEALVQSFALSNKEKKRLSFFQSFEQEFQLAPDQATLLKYLDQYKREDLIAYSYRAQVAFAQKADLEQQRCEEKDWKHLRHRLTKTPLPEFPLTGKILMAKGISAGVELGQLLQKMRLYWLSEAAKPGCEEILRHFGL
ncbi:CCA tRNA nucleotidyltransferase [Acetobacteraceae bacterium]|nr:CCA tRNA nucleotidyltransferase [Acetobacteraceae bacterium]